MPDRALTSSQNSIAYVEQIARDAANGDGDDVLEVFARKHKFASASELLNFLAESAVLLDRHTACYQRLLPTDQDAAWEFIADPKKLRTWMFDAEFEARPGADFNFAPDGWHGKIGVFEEGCELRFDAIKGGWTWFSLATVEGGTMFTLRDYMAPALVIPNEIRSSLDPGSLPEDQPGGAGSHWQGVLAGWHTGVDDLRGKFSGSQTHWDYEALCELYKLLIIDYHRPY